MVFFNNVHDYHCLCFPQIPRVNILLLAQVVEIILATIATIIVTKRFKETQPSENNPNEEQVVYRKDTYRRGRLLPSRIVKIFLKLRRRSELLSHRDLDCIFFLIFSTATVTIYITLLTI